MLRSVIGEGKVLYATPFADEGGFCTDDPEVEQALTKAAVDLGERIGADYLEVRQRRPLDGNYPCDESRVTLEMPLPDDSEVLWDDLSKNLRKKVRRARRDGLVCEEASSEMLPVFYDVYAANMQELGSPMHSAEFFEALFKRLPEDMFLLVVKLEEEDKPVGAAVAIRFSDRLTVLCAHSLREFFDLYPNNLLYWRIFEVAIENGCRVANFGRSPVDSGIYRYKKSWHMEDHQLYYTRVPIHSEPTIDDSRESTSYSLFRKVWPKLPSSIARSIGPRIWARLPI
jgi:FemAB-related protein (PEP-CTERM system-associated)